MSNEELYNQAIGAIRKLFDDRSVSLNQALTNMRALVDEIEILTEALESDINKTAGTTDQKDNL